MGRCGCGCEHPTSPDLSPALSGGTWQMGPTSTPHATVTVTVTASSPSHLSLPSQATPSAWST